MIPQKIFGEEKAVSMLYSGAAKVFEEAKYGAKVEVNLVPVLAFQDDHGYKG